MLFKKTNRVMSQTDSKSTVKQSNSNQILQLYLKHINIFITLIRLWELLVLPVCEI